MPLIKHITEGDTIIGIWDIQEDFDQLLSMVKLSKKDNDKLYTFKNPKRKLEWLSVRACLKAITNQDLDIFYTQNRKPYLHKHIYNISISHSHKMALVILHKEKQVGADIELISDRIERITSKFISKDEIITDDVKNRTYHYYLHWCAKEALFKIIDDKGLIFDHELIISPFEPEKSGQMTGTYFRDNSSFQFILKYFTFDEYVVVWSVK